MMALSFFILASSVAQAGLLFNYSQLALKDMDQMTKLVQSKITEGRKSGGDKTIPLKEGLQSVFSRPNSDFMIEKILGPLKTELEEETAWESSIEALVREARGALKNSRAFKPVVQVTYLIFLENLLSEMKPRVAEPFENRIITEIRDAKIEVTKEALHERKLRMMKETISPSAIAANILKDYDQSLADKAKENKK